MKGVKIKFNLKREVTIVTILLIVGTMIVFTEGKQEDVAIQDIRVKIENKHENHFLDEEDILSLMQLDLDNIRGVRVSKFGLKEIEKKLMQEKHIRDAQLYTDLKGNLLVKVSLRRPIARIVRNDGPDGYIAEDGTIMPVSEKFTARVVLISGAYVKRLLQHGNLYESKEGTQLMDMINLIREDDFWSAQIAQIDMNAKARITLQPQIGHQTIEFGLADNAEIKFRKLKIFYKEIIPEKGWNRYKRVNLEYAGQIVAE